MGEPGSQLTVDSLKGGNNQLEDWVPKLGQEFDSEEDAWTFYLRYAGRLGFGIRKEYINKNSKTGKVTSRLYVCAKEGFRGKDKRDKNTRSQHAETRCGCLARMCIKHMKSGKFHVSKFEADHNHILHLPCTSYMIRSQRGIADKRGHEVELANASGLGAKHELSSKQIDRRSSLGYTWEDQNNYLPTKRQRDLKYGETGSLLRYFQHQSLENPSFYHSVQLDNEEQITNVFWVDAKMIIDYAQFGDVITFDTTFSTNREFIPLGLFVGFNHHKEVVIFGASLIYDETVASFEWVFKTFLEAHQHKKPLTIFTDQCAAIAKALSNVMPETYHGLCAWHIVQNGIKHLGNSFNEESGLFIHFKQCVFNYEEEIEFEEAWKEMLTKHGLVDSLWLDSIYELKEKWARAYMKRVVTLGMRSAQLIESLNTDLKDYLKSDLDIALFFKHFESVVDEKRHNELETEFHSRENLPNLRLKKCPMLRQAALVYTPTIYEMFVDQFDESQGASIKERIEDSDMYEYAVCIPNEKFVHRVTAKPSDQTFCCSCRKFETVGILCSHVLKVLNILDIHSIPNQYVLKRWTRESRNGIGEHYGAHEAQDNATLTVGNRFRILCSIFVDIASRAAESEKTFAMACKMSNELRHSTNGILQNYLKSAQKDTTGDDGVSMPTDLNMDNENLEPSGAFRLKKRKGVKKKTKQKSWIDMQSKRPKACVSHKNLGSMGDAVSPPLANSCPPLPVYQLRMDADVSTLDVRTCNPQPMYIEHYKDVAVPHPSAWTVYAQPQNYS